MNDMQYVGAMIVDVVGRVLVVVFSNRLRGCCYRVVSVRMVKVKVIIYYLTVGRSLRQRSPKPQEKSMSNGNYES